MAVYKGLEGSVLKGTYTIAELNNWTVDIKSDKPDSTSFGDSWKEETACLRSWSGSAKGRLDISDTNGQIALKTCCTGATTASMVFKINATTQFSGDAWVDMSVSTPEGDLVDVNFAFTGTGALTYSAS